MLGSALGGCGGGGSGVWGSGVSGFSFRITSSLMGSNFGFCASSNSFLSRSTSDVSSSLAFFFTFRSRSRSYRSPSAFSSSSFFWRAFNLFLRARVAFDFSRPRASWSRSRFFSSSVRGRLRPSGFLGLGLALGGGSSASKMASSAGFILYLP